MSKEYQMSDCRALGLEGLPVVVEANKVDGRYGLKSLSMLVRDVDDDVLVGGKNMFTAKRLLSEQYEDSDFAVVAFIVDTGYQHFLRDGVSLDDYASNLSKHTSFNLQYGLACIGGPGLTIPQREAAAAIVRITESYLPPIERQDDYVFPATLDDFAEQDGELSRRCLPWKSFTEFEDGGKWYVAVVKGMEHIGDPENDERIGAAFILLMHFDLVESDGDTMEPIAEMLNDIPPAQEALTGRARRAFRIEDKLDAMDIYFKQQ